MKRVVVILISVLLVACNNSSQIESKMDTLGKKFDSSAERIWDSTKEKAKDIKDAVKEKLETKKDSVH